MPRIGIVKSGSPQPWDIPLLKKILDLGSEASFICSSSASLQVPFRRAVSLRSFSIVDRLIRGKLGWSLNKFFKYSAYDSFSRYISPKKAFKDFDYLVFGDDAYSLPNQAVKTKSNFGVIVWENIPYHYQYEYIRPIKNSRTNVLKHASHIFPVSRDAGKCLEEDWIRQDKVHLVHPGIDTDFFSPGEITNNLGIKEELIRNNTIISSSRITYNKGITYILRAMSILKRRNVKINYLAAGQINPEFGDYCKRLVGKLGIEDQVTFLGKVDYHSLVNLYRMGDLFLFPSIPTLLWEEQMGYALIESQSCGLPAVRSDSTSLGEVSPETFSRPVPPGNPEKLADAIQILIEDPLLRSRLGKESRDYVNKNYNVLETAKSYIKYSSEYSRT